MREVGAWALATAVAFGMGGALVMAILYLAFNPVAGLMIGGLVGAVAGVPVGAIFGLMYRKIRRIGPPGGAAGAFGFISVSLVALYYNTFAPYNPENPAGYEWLIGVAGLFGVILSITVPVCYRLFGISKETT